MYDKWSLKRSPFYTRAIDRTSIEDFAARKKEAEELKNTLRSREGVAAVIGERGVGTTSLANFCRFNHETAYTPKYEVRAEHFNDGMELLEALVYIIAHDVAERKIQSKAAKRILEHYKGKKGDINVSAKVMGVGVSLRSLRGGKTSAPYLIDELNELIGDILKKRNYKFAIFQINNLDVHSRNSESIEKILDFMRDIFHTRNTVWYLLGDTSLEQRIKHNMSRVSSIIKHWIHVLPMNTNDFYALYMKRIQNSGPNAVSPFTRDAIDKLSEATMGRPRFSLDVAGRLLDMYAETVFPERIDKAIVERFAKKEIHTILQIDNLPEISIKLVTHIAKNPGKTSSELAKSLGIHLGNLNKYTGPLEEKRLIYIEKKGRSTCHYAFGFGKLL